MQQEIINDAKQRMQKSVDALHSELSRLRMGRATPSLLEHVTIDYYGSQTPLTQVASVSAEDARTLTVKPWEKNLIPDIEKAIMSSDLGLNPATSGDVIRIPMPALTEERRKELIKIVKAEAENAKIAVRNIRRDANNQFKEYVKAKEMTEDDERKAQDQIQKLTDSVISEIDKVFEHKEAELMEI